MSDFREKAELQKAVGGVAASLEFLVAVPDELDACIVERRFGAAVGIVEKARAALQSNEALEAQLSSSGLRARLAAAIGRVQAAMVRVLRSDASDAAEARAVIALMRRAAWPAAAREAFLAQRSHAIRAAVARVAFGGDRRQFVGDVARLVFARIVATVITLLLSMLLVHSFCFVRDYSAMILLARFVREQCCRHLLFGQCVKSINLPLFSRNTYLFVAQHLS
jgi:hypothetical protein